MKHLEEAGLQERGCCRSLDIDHPDIIEFVQLPSELPGSKGASTLMKGGEHNERVKSAILTGSKCDIWLTKINMKWEKTHGNVCLEVRCSHVEPAY